MLSRRPLSVVLLIGLMLGSSPLSPLGGAEAWAQDLPYRAVVALDRVPVRSGAGRMYYEVGTLNEGDVVTVEDELFGWYKIRVPEGVYSFVERKNVDASGDGSTGTVNTPRTQVYAAHATKGPADSYRSQADLDEDDKVKIVGEVGNVYRIVPPDDVYVFLPPASVTPQADAPAPAVVEGSRPQETEPLATPESERPGASPTPSVAGTTPEPTPAAPEVTAETFRPEPKPEPRTITPAEVTVNPPVLVEARPQPEPAPEATAAVPDPPQPRMNPKLAAIEEAMSPYFDLPVERQPIGRLVQAYAGAASLEDLSPGDLQLIQDRLATIERNRELANALNDIETVQARIEPAPTTTMSEGTPGSAAASTDGDGTAAAAPTATFGEIPAFAEPLPEPPPQVLVVDVPPPSSPGNSTDTPAAPVQPAASSAGVAYDAVGILTASTVHNGSNQPELLRLVDPTARRTIAYVEPGGPVDTLQMLGKLVGIVGDTQYDPTTRLRLIDVQTMDVLTPAQ